jgi:hypothetical protein
MISQAGGRNRGSALWAVSSASNYALATGYTAALKFFGRTCFSLSRRAQLAPSFPGQAKACPTEDFSPLAVDLPRFAGWRAEGRRRLKSAPQSSRQELPGQEVRP